MKTIRSAIKAPEFIYSFPQDKEKIAFLDIETTGLSAKASSLYLIGTMHYNSKEGIWILTQWFADNYQSEKNILQEFLAFLENYSFLYHFNGKTFDIPYILQKCNRHALTVSRHNAAILEDGTDTYSIDLLKHVRRLRHVLNITKCSQTSLEQWLGCRRTDCFNGGELIPVYSEYMQQRILAPEKAAKLEKVLLLHNHDDIKMMLEICSILSYESYFMAPAVKQLEKTGCFSHLEIRTEKDSLTISMPAPIPVPKKVSLCTDYPEYSSASEGDRMIPDSLSPAVFSLDSGNCTLTVPLFHGCLKYFYPDTKDYYYLPKEDMAVHKSIAEFVEKQYRQKATAATCYTKAEGTFLPCLASYRHSKKTKEAPKELPRFIHAYKDKLSFCRLPDDYLQNPGFWQAYLTGEFCALL